jgi:hypothetical protein
VQEQQLDTKWIANYFNEDKTKSYGKDEGFATGLVRSTSQKLLV